MTNAPVSCEGLGRWDRWARRIVRSRLERLDLGRLTITDAEGSATFGPGGGLSAEVRVRSPRLYREALLGGALGVAKSYLRGDWETHDLTALLRLFARSRSTTARLDRVGARLLGAVQRMRHALRSNTRLGSRRNIAAHYDLGNDFFQLWLDETMAYSCGLFADHEATLREASVAKFERICQLLELSGHDELLEIGSGWGGLALHAAQQFGCRVTTTTLSEEQALWARRRVAETGCEDRIEVLQRDYRDLRGQFDKLASIEMIEAVGDRYLERFFAQCGRLLRPAGTCVLQAIVLSEREHPRYLRSVDFIQRYVFPGGCLPSLSRILESVARASDLRMQSVEDFSPHYARTLAHWRRAFASSLDAVRALGFTEEFIRLWEYYLSYCEAAFEERCVGVVQIVFDKPLRRRNPRLAGPSASRAKAEVPR